MSLNRCCLRDERAAIWVAAILGAISGALCFFFWVFSGPSENKIPAAEVWAVIAEEAPKKGLDPGFVYSLAWAESSLDARAKTSMARGIMQLTEGAWAEVSDLPYRRAWDWKTNLRISMDYMNWCRDFLRRHDSFSYELLAASYRYGPFYVKKRKFQLSKVKAPKDEIYKAIFAGNLRPIAPPAAP